MVLTHDRPGVNASGLRVGACEAIYFVAQAIGVLILQTADGEISPHRGATRPFNGLGLRIDFDRRALPGSLG